MNCRQLLPWVAAVGLLVSTRLRAEDSAVSSGSTLPKTGVLLKINSKIPDFSFGDLQEISTRSASRSHSVRSQAPIDSKSGGYRLFNILFANAKSCQDFNVPGTHVITRNDKYADVFVPLQRDSKSGALSLAPDMITKLQQAPGLILCEVARSVVVPPLPSVKPLAQTTRAIPEETAAGGVGKFTGKGVIIAIVDSGIDLSHPDFVSKDANGKDVSRLLYFWDTTSEQYKTGTIGKPAPYSYPNDTPDHPSRIGTIFSRDEITAALHAPRSPIAEQDTLGHGTACAGIAAGNGQGGPKDSKGKPLYAGVAPEADLIAVRVGTGENLQNSYLLGAVCEWLDQVAGSRPLVVSCSFGGVEGGHDGYRVEELELNSHFPLDKKGRAICIAAGNEGEDRFHADCEIQGKDKPAVLHWTCDGPAKLDIYIQGSDPDDILYDMDHTSGITPNKDQTGKVVGYNLHAATNALTKQLVLSTVATGGEGSLALFSKSNKSLAADAYFTGGENAEFADGCYTARNLVGTPGTAANAITVASYDWNDRFNYFGEVLSLPPVDSDDPMRIGALSGYSSPGFLRIGKAIKPEIAAPGEWYTAPAPENVAVAFTRDTTGLYQVSNGTSSATPYTAGVIALLFQKNPQLTLGQVKQLLEKTASPPAKGLDHASPLPNPYWGYGKLDRAAVMRLLEVSQ